MGGGASLGAYEAGYLYYFVQTLARSPRLARLRIATGTSAGSLNALLALLASCEPANPRPESSAFYESWTETTLRALHGTTHRSADALFSRQPMVQALDALEARWARGLPATCDVVLGVPTTRVRPLEVSLHGHDRLLPRTSEQFVVRIRGRGPGVVPSVENYRDLENGFAIALLPVDGEQPDEFDAIRDLLFASGAFPLLFAPVELAHCMVNVGEAQRAPCTPETAVTERFVDGGLGANQPLRLAAIIARTSLVAGVAGEEVHRFRERPDVRIRELPRHTFHFELDPQSYPFPDAEADDEEASGVVESTMALGMHVLSGFRTQEIQTLLEDFPEIRDVVRPSITYFPPVSSLLSDFFGVVDRQLADFDFVLGMRAARQQLEEELFPALAPGVSPGASSSGFPRLDSDSPVTRRFECMRAFLDEEGDVRVACAAEEDESFRAALQLTVDRLFSNCADYADAVTQPPHAHCRAAMRGEAPPRLVALPRGGPWRLPGTSDDGASRAAILRLAAYRFHFRDLGLAPEEASRVLVRLRRQLGAVAHDFVGDQDAHAQLLDAISRAALNSLAYAPPHVVAHGVVGSSSELGVSVGAPYGHVPWLRATAAVELGGLDRPLGVLRYSFRLAPTLGVELAPTFLGRSVWQLRFGARAGYAFSTQDAFGRGGCDAADGEQGACSRPVVTSYVALSLLELIRFQLGFAVRPVTASDPNRLWSFGVSAGLQLHSRR